MRIFQRFLLLALVIALGVWLFHIGREHQIFLDNKTITIGTENGEQTYKALQQVNVSVNGGDFIELFARDRDAVPVVGPKFTFKVEVLDGLGGDVVQIIERELYLGFARDIMLSMPILVNVNSETGDNYILPAPNAN